MNELLATILPVRLEWACLVLTRVLAVVSTSPFFGTTSPWRGYRIALGVAMTVAMIPVSGSPDWDGPRFGLALVPLVAQEFLAGALMGWIVTAAFASVRGAGELVGAEMGLNLSSLFDPLTGTNTPVVSSLYNVFAGLVFIGLDAHRWVVAGLARSFERLPVGTFVVDNDVLAQVIHLTSRLLESGVALAAPVMVAMFLVSLVMGIISRAVPQLNILDVGYSLRVASALAALALLLPALRVGLEELFRVLQSSLLDVLPARTG